MDKFLKVCGIIFLSLIGIGVILAAIFIPRAMVLTSGATTFINQELPKIAENWDQSEFLSHATSEFTGSATPEQIRLLWAKFRLLGKLKSHDEPVGRVMSQAYTNGPSGTFGIYTVRAKFENADAKIDITLRRVDDGWKFVGFRVNSELFLK